MGAGGGLSLRVLSGHRGMLGEGRHPEESDAQGLSFGRDGTFQNKYSLSMEGLQSEHTCWLFHSGGQCGWVFCARRGLRKVQNLNNSPGAKSKGS